MASFQGFTGTPSCCPEYTNTSGNDIRLGVLYDHQLNYDWMIGARLSYMSHQVEFQSDEALEIFLIPEMQSYNGTSTHFLNSDLEIIYLDINSGYSPIKSLNLIGGLKFGFISGGTFEQIERITDPVDRGIFKEEGTSFRNFYSGEINEISSFQFALNAGVSYRLPLNKSKSLFLVPELFYHYNTTSPVSNVSWNFHSFTAGLAIKYRQPPPPPPPPSQPPNPPYPKLEKVKLVPNLFASVKANKVDSLGKKKKDLNLKVEDFVTINMRPLLNFIFFEDNSSDIPERYSIFNSPEEIDFEMNNLENLDGLKTYYEVLNIYAKRLQDNPDESITLIGTNSDENKEENNLKLSRERSEKVKSYLTDVWGIEAERIKVKARNLPQMASRSDTLTGLQENRRVEIIASPVISGSVMTVDTLRLIPDTKFKFDIEVESGAGIKNWRLVVEQNNDIVKEISGNGKPGNDVIWTIDKNSNRELFYGNRFNYYVEVEDTLGQKYKSAPRIIPVDRLTVDKKRLEQRKDMEYEYYSLILFDYGRSDLGSEHKKVVDFVKHRISKGSKVRVFGYSDSVGDERINERISRSRAFAVARRLNVLNLEIEGVGESQLLFDNELPEGRFYCRTVRIEIETPVNQDE